MSYPDKTLRTLCDDKVIHSKFSMIAEFRYPRFKQYNLTVDHKKTSLYHDVIEKPIFLKIWYVQIQSSGSNVHDIHQISSKCIK